MGIHAARCVPFLQVADARRSLDFYCGRLGFKKNWEHQLASGFPLVACISLGGATLFLTEHPESAAGTLVYFYVPDVDQFMVRVRAALLEIEWGPSDQPWGMREVQLRDPDGNKLRFGEELRGPA
jgi:catechol 2,3-dioxygenase-like lactoylglutathione lyase family enzyme